MIPDKQKSSGKGRLGSAKGDREAIRQCFLFSNHLIVTTRTQAYHEHTFHLFMANKKTYMKKEDKACTRKEGKVNL